MNYLQRKLDLDSTGGEPFDSLQHHSDLAVLMFEMENRRKVNNYLRALNIRYSGWSEGSKYLIVLFPSIEKKEESVFIKSEFEASWVHFMEQLQRNNVAHAVAVFNRLKVWSIRAVAKPERDKW